MRIGTAIAALRSLLFVLIGIYVGVIINTTSDPNPESSNAINIRHGIHHNDKDDGESHSQILEQLKKSKNEIERLKSLTQDLNSKLKVSCKTNENTKQLPPATTVMTSSAKANRHPLCQSILPHPVPTAMDIWNQHILGILTNSRSPNDIRFNFHDFTTQLLQIVSPRLPRSVKTTPFDWRPVENALTVAWERYQYLQLPKEERDKISILEKQPRPLKILAMGGSVAVGRNCAALKGTLGFEWVLPLRECNWIARLDHFLNNFFLGEDKNRVEQLIDVSKVAMGGTNTATGSVLWQYDLIPEKARSPDIVINAYSTNDMHVLTMLEAESSNMTLRDKTFDVIQQYVRQVLGSKHCRSSSDGSDNNNNKVMIPPLLLHMDDYLGNEQVKIWETTELAQGVQVLANYYGFVSISYADVIREFVYGDTYETWFSSEWWVGGEKDKKYERQIHPGMGMHISQIWVAAYNLLHLASSYCSMPTDVIRHLGKNNITDYQAGLWGLPELGTQIEAVKGKPLPHPEGLPPELTQDLLLEDITSLWKSQSQSEKEPSNPATLCKSNQGSSAEATLKKCPFSWVSGLSLQQNDVALVKKYFETQPSTWEGWELKNDEKIGFIPKKQTDGKNPRMVLDFTYPQTIHSVTIFFMKSYGDTWENSELNAKIWSSVNNEQYLLEERSILGTHDKKTSEMYTEEIILSNPSDAGEKIQLEVSLVGGTMFKIMGIVVCS